MPSRIALARRLYQFNKPDLLSTEGANLPECYKKFYKEWKFEQPQPVHYIPHKIGWRRNDQTGEIKKIQNQPIPLLFPPESHHGIWGGEGVIKGFQKRQTTKQRVPHFWVPHLIEAVVYSEILNKRMSLTITNRTIDLIIASHGFDNYLLKSKACDLQSTLALKLKQRMLMALFNKDLYPEDTNKAAEVYSKYKHYLDGYTKEDIYWYGLTFDEALRKSEKESQVEQEPLKVRLRKEFLIKLANSKPQEQETAHVVPEERSWITKMNPFGSRK